MKKFALLLGCALLPIMAHAETATPPAASDQPTPEQSRKFSYAIGRDLAKSMQPVSSVIDLEALKQGLDEAAAGKPSPYPDAELDEAKTQMGQLLKARLEAEQAAKAAANLQAAQAFLQKNGRRKGVTTTASGLQYEVLKGAKGEHPKVGSNVTVHYRGTLLDGTEFDSSYARNTPVTFPLQNVIAGWTEGVQLMAPGAKYKFYLPPQLGYAERGAGTRIGPNELLTFEIELISFDDKP